MNSQPASFDRLTPAEIGEYTLRFSDLGVTVNCGTDQQGEYKYLAFCTTCEASTLLGWTIPRPLSIGAVATIAQYLKAHRPDPQQAGAAFSHLENLTFFNF